MIFMLRWNEIEDKERETMSGHSKFANIKHKKENMHAFHEAFEETARKEVPIDIRNEIKRRFKDNRI